MKKHEYRDFELLIERRGDGYRARVFRSPAGEASDHFELPLSGEQIDAMLSEVGRRRRSVRRFETVEMEAIQRFGGALFDAVFDGEVGQVFRESVNSVRQDGIGLRLRLRLNEAPDLAELPWEFLYDRRSDRFPALSVRTPIVRYLELSASIRPLAVTPPIRVLVAAASPTNYGSIGVDAEWRGMRASLDPLVRSGRLSIDRLEPATIQALERELDQGVYHVFHFIGHGKFSEGRDEGLLALEDDRGQGHPVDSQRLGTLFHDHPSLRLAVLNACEGARGSHRDPFSGVAQTLARQEIPAVVGMQFEVPDTAAVAFSCHFYDKLAQGWPVEAAVVAARKALYLDGKELEWGAPVVYLRAASGQLFELAGETSVARLQETAEPAPLHEDAHEREPAPQLGLLDRLAIWLLRHGRPGTAVLYGLCALLHLMGGLGLVFPALALWQGKPPENDETRILVASLFIAGAGLTFGWLGLGPALARRHSQLGRRVVAGATLWLAITAFVVLLFLADH